MELREIQKSDYNLILELDDKVYPVAKENKINAEIIDHWYHEYPKYGMIYTIGSDIVAMAIAIPMPMPTWYQLIHGECFENTLNIDWSSTNNNVKITKGKRESLISIGLHIYHIEVLNRSAVGKNFYQQMLTDIVKISKHYHHQVEGFSGYCVTPKGNRLFQEVLLCRNADENHQLQNPSTSFLNTSSNNTTTTTTNINTNLNISNSNNFTAIPELTSEFIIQHPITQQIKIVECPWNTDITQPYLDTSVQPPQLCPFFSKCNMLYTIKEKDIHTSPVWNYL